MQPSVGHRVLKYFNIAVGVAVLLFAIAVFWWVWRPLPQTSGVLTAPVSARATVVRDRFGVPHIAAQRIEDALFLQGFATAQDRFWQMDGLRRSAAGELAEILGPSALESDRMARRLRLRRIAEEHALSLPERDRPALAAYTRGVNFYLEAHRSRLPLEFTLLRYRPRPWTVPDSMLVALHMFRVLGTSWQDELTKLSMLVGGDRARVEALFPLEFGVSPGSNAWVVSGARSATGRPILANDTHLEFSIPGIWYMVHVQAPGLNVAGVSLPGLPGVVVGHNEHIAWGVTNLGFDVQDLYVEKLDLTTGRYDFQGRIEQARREREVIRVKDAPPVVFEQWVTPHGPVFPVSGIRYPVALRWVAADPGGQFPLLDLNRARDWFEFTSALRRFPGPAQNFVYADARGNIGFQVAGRLPIRSEYAGDIPVDGASGKFEWQGSIPFERLPAAYNPPAGLIVTANQNPFPLRYPYRVHANFASRHRARQIYDRLKSQKQWRPDEMLEIQKDVYSAFSHMLARQAVAAYDRRKPRDPALGVAAGILRAWNGQIEKDQAAPLIATLLYEQLRRAIAERAAPGKGLLYNPPVAYSVVEAILRYRPPGWFPDYDDVLLRSLSLALNTAEQLQGRNPRKWAWGSYNHLRLAHPVAGRLPLFGRYFNIGSVPMSGSDTTVKQTTTRLGPAMRMVVDLSDWDRSLLNITTGQSGHILSRHYKDQWDAYYAGRSFPLPFRKVEGDRLVVEPLGGPRP